MLILMLFLTAYDSSNYKKATALYEGGEFSEAIAIFTELGDYKDSTQMRGYKIIKEGGKWCFQLIPRNNNNQFVGRSRHFDSQQECVQGVKQLRNLIVENQIKSLDSPYIVFIKGEIRTF